MVNATYFIRNSHSNSHFVVAMQHDDDDDEDDGVTFYEHHNDKANVENITMEITFRKHCIHNCVNKTRSTSHLTIKVF